MAICTITPKHNTQPIAALGTSRVRATITSTTPESGAEMPSSHLRPTRSTRTAAMTTPIKPISAITAVVNRAADCAMPASARIEGNQVKAR